MKRGEQAVAIRRGERGDVVGTIDQPGQEGGGGACVDPVEGKLVLAGRLAQSQGPRPIEACARDDALAPGARSRDHVSGGSGTSRSRTHPSFWSTICSKATAWPLESSSGSAWYSETQQRKTL